MTAEQLRILRHMLGIDDPYMSKPKPYRDYYCANPGNQELHELMRLGMVRLYSTRDSYEWFCCTDAGRAAAMASQRAIRKTKAQRIYAKFLDVSDCWPDLTFKKFLTDPHFIEARREA
jgi:hypothetical protein